MRNLILLALLAAGCAKAGAQTMWIPDATNTRTSIFATVDAGYIPYWSAESPLRDDLCETRDGTGDLEPCQWQRRADKAKEAREQEGRDVKACRAKGCRLEHFSDTHCDDDGQVCSTYAIYRGPDPRMWSCNCDWKPPKKTASAKGARP